MSDDASKVVKSNALSIFINSISLGPLHNLQGRGEAKNISDEIGIAAVAAVEAVGLPVADSAGIGRERSLRVHLFRVESPCCRNC